jgi:hypothetical protein
LDRVSLVPDCPFARSILLGAFGKARQGRPRLLVRSLVEDASQGVVDGSAGPTAVGLDVDVEALVIVVTEFFVSGFCPQRAPWAQGGEKGDQARGGRTGEGRVDERSSEGLLWWLLLLQRNLWSPRPTTSRRKAERDVRLGLGLGLGRPRRRWWEEPYSVDRLDRL